ncbi:tricarballylate utilization 4Fe-4S protein TcuB [Methylobacterium nodulans]|uniref:CitB domain protein n=1 Tax=Methylobacterium nodulans (strain LMG 21967 / CNCM I-2342 / ORS 2060) TaxID=460265 RepID=B8IW53_METNO|nr:tricarballylate utilization 4Fe-4S protein TcuB [Methylobacterium nodulans]ACL62643.1 CitB domain protein [Methylobacterium nodulans ORS 2060]
MLATDTKTSGTTAHHASAALAEADRLMTVCNSCRYCEGLCAVFPAMEMRRSFSDGDLNYLANLCHSCGACFYDCQFSPPHAFDVNVPRVLAQVRNESYAHYAWPRALAPLFARNGTAIALITSACVAAFLFGFMALNDPKVMFGAQLGEGAFYRLMPHNAMAFLFGAAFLYALVALGLGLLRFWRDIGETRATLQDVGYNWQATQDTLRLRYLDGGGAGCMNQDDNPSKDRRRFYHHLTFYGFMLCFASTSVATLYHYLLGREAPYPWWDLPVVLGTLGGIGLVIGPLGLLRAKAVRDETMRAPEGRGMENAFTLMLFALGTTGLALLVLRSTPAMGTLLAVHLGAVFGFFVTMPYGKFVHGLYRYAALVRFAKERKALHGPSPAECAVAVPNPKAGR